MTENVNDHMLSIIDSNVYIFALVYNIILYNKLQLENGV